MRKPQANTLDNLVPQLDGVFWPYTSVCCVELEIGARCHELAIGFFPVNDDLRQVEMCQYHALLTMQKLEQNTHPH